ncbi:hypothetical protein [Stenotrophomonas sp. 22385]|jgi:hypothetical protein|uniref:hypothetical protein n=1 Tax=Stenotrophomonas sp. 22385 TaxID=3453915 RepID=UPI003F860C70
MSDPSLDLLHAFKGKTVTLARLEDQIALSTDDGWSLHIYNRASFEHSLQNSILLNLKGCTIDGTTMTLAFDDGSALQVDLSDSGYDGPEAMQLNGPDGSVIIWN